MDRTRCAVEGESVPGSGVPGVTDPVAAFFVLVVLIVALAAAASTILLPA